MFRLYVHHRVEDYPTWRQAYDGFDEERRTMGVTGDAVYQKVGDANDVTVWHDFDTAESAEAFKSSDRLREVMAEAGVVGAPDVWITTEA